MKNKIAKLKDNFQEIYTVALIVIGLPIVAHLFFGWRSAVSVFIVSQLVVSIIAMRYK